MKTTKILVTLACLLVSASTFADPYWRQPWQQNGCTGKGTRQYASQLMGIRGSWEEACAHMPADINGAHFDHPTRCINNFGMWGEFDGVPDNACADPNTQVIVEAYPWGFHFRIPESVMGQFTDTGSAAAKFTGAIAPFTGPAAPYIAAAAAYCALEMSLMKSVDHGRGVYLSMLWVAPGVFVPTSLEP